MKTFKIIIFGIKNNRVLAGFMLLICGFVFPVISVMDSSRTGNSFYYIAFFGCITAYFAGLVFPMVFFSYTHNRRLNDFYAAMPVKRRQYFWGYFFSGIIMFIVPLIIMDFLLLFFLGGRGYNLKLSSFLGPVAMFFSLYCSMTLAVMFSGSGVSTVITFLLRNIFVVCLVAPILFMAGVDVSSYYLLLYDKAIVAAPLLGFFPFLDEQLWWVWIWQFGIGILEIIVAFFLHKYRKSETTMALAFPKSRYPYQYIVTLMFVMAVNTVMLIILGLSNGFFNNLDERFSLGSNDLKTLIFFDVIGALLIFILLNIVLERSSRAAFKKLRHLLFFFVGFFAVAGISSRLLSYIPKVYTPIEPDYAIVSVYRPVDPSSVDPNSAGFEDKLMRGEYVGAVYYFEDEETGDYHKVMDWLLKRDDQFIVTSRQKLKELVKVCEGRMEHYNIRSSNHYSTSYGGHYGYSSYSWNYHGEEAIYFDIFLAKGNYSLSSNTLGEKVCTRYSVFNSLERSGYVFGSSSGLDVYKDYTVEIPEGLNW